MFCPVTVVDAVSFDLWIIDPPHRPIDEVSVEDFKWLLNLNLVSYFAACKVNI